MIHSTPRPCPPRWILPVRGSTWQLLHTFQLVGAFLGFKRSWYNLWETSRHLYQLAGYTGLLQWAKENGYDVDDPHER